MLTSSVTITTLRQGATLTICSTCPKSIFVGTSLYDSNAWIDWSDVVSELRTRSLEFLPHGAAYDNFPIRSYPQTEPITIFNLCSEPKKETYQAGDTLKGIIYVENNSKVDYTEDYFDLQLAVSIGDDVKNYPIAELKSLKAGEKKSFTYSYTVKKKDAAAGSLTITAAVLFNGEEVDYGALFDESLTYTVKTSAGTSSVDAAVDKNPATGSDIFSVVMLAGAAAAIAFANRKRR